MTEKTKIVLIQDTAGQTRRVRVGEAEFPVLTAGPVPLPGRMGVALTVDNVEIGFEKLPVEAAKA